MKPEPSLTRRQFGAAALGAAAVAALPGVAAEDTLDEALALVSTKGPEYGGGLANHGPMACEALIALDRRDSVLPFAASYARRLDAHPAARVTLNEAEATAAFGHPPRVAELTAFFAGQIAQTGWRPTLAGWAPRLLPGLSAAAFHGVIRTAHATRSLSRRETAPRRAELAEGLGYWAAQYHPLPGVPGTGSLSAGRLLERLTPLPSEQRRGGSITKALSALDGNAAFAKTAPLLAVGDPATTLSDITGLFARIYIASAPRGNVIAFLHTVTGPAAVRLLLPFLEADLQRRAVAYAWQAAAGIFVAIGGSRPEAAVSQASAGDLVDRAVATGDEHAIKLTEACLREHAVRPDPAYLAAARDASERLG